MTPGATRPAVPPDPLVLFRHSPLARGEATVVAFEALPPPAAERWELSAGFVLSADEGEAGPTVRGPGVAWIAADRAGCSPPGGVFRTAPHLPVKVVSPSNSAADIQETLLQYVDAGSRQVWVAYPRTPVRWSSTSPARPPGSSKRRRPLRVAIPAFSVTDLFRVKAEC